MKFWEIIKNWAGNNPVIKLLAVGIAVGLWFLASGWVYESSTVRLPVNLRLAEGMTQVDIKPAMVTVRLEYPREYGTLIESGELPIRIIHDLTETRTPGRVVFNLPAADVEKSPRLRVTGIYPSRIVAEIDRLAEKALPVWVVYRGNPAPGFRVAGERVVPPEVVVPGPAGVLEEMTAVKTRPINITGRELPFDQRVNLEPVSPYFDPELEPVTVIVQILEELGRREFPDIEVGILRGAMGVAKVTYEPETVDLVVRGSSQDLDAVTADDLTAYIDVIGLKPGVYNLPLRTNLPGGVTLEKADPSVIKITIESGLGEVLEP